MENIMTAKDIGDLFLKYAFDVREHFTCNLREHLPKYLRNNITFSLGMQIPEHLRKQLSGGLKGLLPDNFDLAKIKEEIKYLQICSLDLGIHSALGSEDTPEKTAILQAYNDSLSKRIQPLPDEIKLEFLNSLKTRFHIYMDTYNRPNHNDIHFILGREFAKLCGYPEDIRVVLVGSLKFSITATEVIDFLKSVKIDL